MSGYKVVSQQLVKKIVPLYESGTHVRDIMGAAGCSMGTVYAALHQEGIALRTRNRKRMRIKPISYTHLDQVWVAEFRGFFYGDGAALFSKFRSLYKPKLMITLRADSEDLLLDVQAHLGGSVDKMRGLTNSWGYKCNPTVRWYTSSYSNILAILRDVLLPGARLLAPKRKQIELLYETVQARIAMPYTLTSDNRAVLHSYYELLKELRHFNSGG